MSTQQKVQSKFTNDPLVLASIAALQLSGFYNDYEFEVAYLITRMPLKSDGKPASIVLYENDVQLILEEDDAHPTILDVVISLLGSKSEYPDIILEELDFLSGRAQYSQFFDKSAGPVPADLEDVPDLYDAPMSSDLSYEDMLQCMVIFLQENEEDPWWREGVASWI